MNALEDRLHAYLNSLESAIPAPSLRRVDKVDARLANAGLYTYLNLKGAVMQPTQPSENPVPMRVRICSHVTQAKFLHVEDSLALSKLRLFAGTYRKGNGMTVNGHAQHFLNVEDARVVFRALAVAEPNFTYKEYKGTAQPDGKVVSRVLSVTSKGDQVYIELKSGPGVKTPTGAVTPNGKAEVEVNVAFKTYEARRLGQTVLAYIQAWDILRLMAHRNLLGKMAAYELVPTTSRNGMNNQRAQSTQTPATGTITRGTPSPHRPANGKQPLVERPNAAASPPVTKPAQTNGSGIAQTVKRQPSAPVAAAKTPLPQATRPVIREQLPAIAKTQTANAAATTPMVKPSQLNKPGVNLSDEEQTTVPDAAAPLLAELVTQSVGGGQSPDRETTMPADAAATAQPSTVSGSTTPRSTPAANSQSPTRPLTRRGPVPRPGLGKSLAGISATSMPRPPGAAATLSNPTSGNPPPVTNGQGRSQPVLPAAAMAMAEAVYGGTDQLLRYRNGTLVDLTNQAEVQAFLQYQQEKQQIPSSRSWLRAHLWRS